MKHAMMPTVLALALVCAGAAKAEMVYVVEVTDFQKKATFEIMGSAELKTLQKDNQRLRKIIADQRIDLEILKEAIDYNSKNS